MPRELPVEVCEAVVAGQRIVWTSAGIIAQVPDPSGGRKPYVEVDLRAAR